MNAGMRLYELGVDKKLNRTPLGEGASMAIHESQSRYVGEPDRPFESFLETLTIRVCRNTFRKQLGNVAMDVFL